jgi:uncharacterized membrane protein
MILIKLLMMILVLLIYEEILSDLDQQLLKIIIILILVQTVLNIVQLHMQITVKEISQQRDEEIMLIKII